MMRSGGSRLLAVRILLAPAVCWKEARYYSTKRSTVHGCSTSGYLCQLGWAKINFIYTVDPSGDRPVGDSAHAVVVGSDQINANST